MNQGEKPLVWLHGKIKTPPFSPAARLEAGYLLRLLQRGQILALPHSRPMPSIDSKCHELRIQDQDSTWRIIYAIASDAVIVLEVFSKRSATTPRTIINICTRRLRAYYRNDLGA